jgi:signal peptidase I
MNLGGMNLKSAAKLLVNLATSYPYRVDDSSMSPTLAGGQYLLARSWRPASRPLGRGEIVVLKHPYRNRRVYVKRIVGLPDENISLNWGATYVDDAPLAEPYLAGTNTTRTGPLGEWWNGPDEYFVMGDNRNRSEDSRAFGPINKGLIIGRVWFRHWPPRAWGQI